MEVIYSKKDEKDYIFYALAKQTKNLYPCIIDQLKIIFGVQSLGTHYCKKGSQIFVLIKVVMTDLKNINIDIKLNELQHNDPLFTEKVRTIYAFRELLGITVSTGNSIRIRQNDDDIKSENILDYWDPISFREPNFSFEKSIISKNVLKKVFNNEYKFLLKYIHSILGIKEKRNIKDVLIRLSIKLENIILKVDNSGGWIVNELMMRFNSFF